MKKTIISLSLILLIFLSACGGKDSIEVIEPLDKIHYKTELLTEINLNRILNVSGFDDKIVIIGTFTDDKKEEAVKAITYDEDGNPLSETVFTPPDSLENGDEGWFDDAYVDENGFIWFLYSLTDEAEEYGGSYIDRYDPNGNHTQTIKLINPSPNLSTSGIRDFFIGDDSYFYICTDNRYTAVFDSDGRLIYEPKNIKTVFKLSDGRVLAETTTWDTNGATIFREIKALEQELGEYIPLRTTWNYNDYLSIYFISGNDEYDFVENTKANIFGHKLNDESRIELINRTEQNIIESVNGLHEYAAMLNDRIFAIEESITRAAFLTDIITYNLIRFEKSDTPSNANKKVITLATMTGGGVLMNTIFEFNRNNPEYYIEIKEYWKDGHSFYDAVTDLNLDLTLGKIPDIFIIQHEMPIDSYIEKGLFVDFYEYIDNDPDLNRDDYLPNILKMQETDGKLYSIAAGFTIDTVLTPASLFSDKTNGKANLTWNDFTTYLDENKEVSIPIATIFHMSKKFMLDKAILLEDFLDLEARKCNFNTSEFVTLLQTINQYFPDPYIDARLDDYLEGRVVFRHDRLRGFFDPKALGIIYFNEPLAYVGLPTVNGTGGSYATLQHRMAISAKSEVKDTAWEYVKGILTDFQFSGVDYGGNLDKSDGVAGFPIHKLALEKMSEAMKISTGEKTVKVYEGIMLTYDPAITDEEVDSILNLIDSLEVHDYSISSEVIAIVLEEADFYFTGQKTAEEVADIIQSRLNIYLAEIK